MIVSENNFSLELWRDIAVEKDGDIEFYLHYDGRKYFGWIFSLNFVEQSLLKGDEYFWAAGYVIVKEISLVGLIKLIENLIADETVVLSEVFNEVD